MNLLGLLSLAEERGRTFSRSTGVRWCIKLRKACQSGRTNETTRFVSRPACMMFTARRNLLCFLTNCLDYLARVKPPLLLLRAGCHAGGGNVVQAGATLTTGDLQKNGMLDPEALYNLIYRGKGKMPGYGINCAPRVRSSPSLLYACSSRIMRFSTATISHKTSREMWP